MDSINRGDWIQTYSGRQFFPADPRPEDIYLEDIAHALSLICRYGGHSDKFYSVAEHSYHVSKAVPETLAMRALLHDAAEAYVGDMLRPTKRMMPEYRTMEKRIMDAICARYSLYPEQHELITEADQRILMDEKAVLLKPPPVEWDTTTSPLGIKIHAFWPPFAEELFMHRAKVLGLTDR